MLAAPDEIVQAEEEGITIHNSKTFTKIVEREGIILGVECLDVKSFHFDEDGRLQVETLENSEHLVEADTVIFAIGQRAVIPQGFGLDGASGIPTEVDACTVSAVREGVFAAGDAVAGPVSIIRAIASGRKSAIAIDKFLGGRGRIDEKLAPPQEATPQVGGPWVGFASMDRREESCVAAEQRVQGFDKVVQDLEEAAAEYESARCLQCDLRLNIRRVKFWGEY